MHCILANYRYLAEPVGLTKCICTNKDSFGMGFTKIQNSQDCIMKMVLFIISHKFYFSLFFTSRAAFLELLTWLCTSSKIKYRLQSSNFCCVSRIWIKYKYIALLLLIFFLLSMPILFQNLYAVRHAAIFSMPFVLCNGLDLSATRAWPGTNLCALPVRYVLEAPRSKKHLTSSKIGSLAGQPLHCPFYVRLSWLPRLWIILHTVHFVVIGNFQPVAYSE